MKNSKKLGIWMDHSNAFIMEVTNNGIVQHVIVSPFTQQEKEIGLSKNERVMHNKEQHEQASYYKEIAETIRSYNEVILFGATEAKNELYNLLMADHLYDPIRIKVVNTDNMTENEKHNFVQKYYE